MSMKRTSGNMYPWVTHTHSHLAGECPHMCTYCYVQAMCREMDKRGIDTMRKKYSGPVRLIEEELKVNYGKNNVIFVDHMNDLWASEVPMSFRAKVLNHCRKYDGNTYVFQTKNPQMYRQHDGFYPETVLYGVTVESDLQHEYGNGFAYSRAPHPLERIKQIRNLPRDWQVFITVEPIMQFSSAVLFSELIAECKPAFVNIGADSKGNNLPEPSKAELEALIAELTKRGVEIREKHNLARIIGDTAALNRKD